MLEAVSIASAKTRPIVGMVSAAGAMAPVTAPELRPLRRADDRDEHG